MAILKISAINMAVLNIIAIFISSNIIAITLPAIILDGPLCATTHAPRYWDRALDGDNIYTTAHPKGPSLENIWEKFPHFLRKVVREVCG